MSQALALLALLAQGLPGLEGQLRLERGWLPAASGSEVIRAGFPERNPDLSAAISAGSLRVVWNGHFLDTRPAPADPRFPSRPPAGDFEFVVPDYLRRPGVVDFHLWDTELDRPLAFRGRVAIVIPTTAELFEASREHDRIVAYVPEEVSESGGRIEAYAMSSGRPLNSTDLAVERRALAFTPDTLSVWVSVDEAAGKLGRLDLTSGSVEQIIDVQVAPQFRDRLEVQVDRSDPRIVLVGNPGIGLVTAYLDGVPLAGEATGSLPLSQDDGNRYLVAETACRLDSALGFTDCEPFTERRPFFRQYQAIWNGRGLHDRTVVDLASGVTLAQFATSTAYLAASNRLLVGGPMTSTVDGNSLHTWNGAINHESWWIDSNARLSAPNRVLTRVNLRVGSGAITGILSARLPELDPAPGIRADAIVNAASGQVGPISPGEIVSIFGVNLGPSQGAGPWFQGRLELAKFTAGVEVFFGGRRGAILYADANQINVVAPESLPARFDLQVSNHEAFSARIGLDRGDANPALFSYSSNGRFYAAALTPEGLVQGPATPLRRDEVVAMFATGLGLPPRRIASRIAARAASTPITPIIRIGGREASVLYSGVSPGLTVGVTQINAIVPADAPTGEAVEVEVEATGMTAGDVWLAIQ